MHVLLAVISRARLLVCACALTAAATGTACKSTSDAALPSAQAAGGLAPCTSPGQTHCVKCDGWPNGVCTPTEAVLVRYDITKHLVTAAGPEPTDPVRSKEPCYECLMHAGCLDMGPPYDDRGHECGDTLDAGSPAQCTEALTCILNTGCARAGISVCYCGDAGIAACRGHELPASGKCAKALAAGLAFDSSDAVNVTHHLTDTSRASGVASQILQCAHSNSCKSCF
jgi:hypothetical protein